jgi:hypothetical protein
VCVWCSLLISNGAPPHAVTDCSWSWLVVADCVRLHLVADVRCLLMLPRSPHLPMSQAGCDAAGTNCIVLIDVRGSNVSAGTVEGAAATAESWSVLPFVPPKQMQLPAANVTAVVAGTADAAAITLLSNATALYVAYNTLPIIWLCFDHRQARWLWSRESLRCMSTACMHLIKQCLSLSVLWIAVLWCDRTRRCPLKPMHSWLDCLPGQGHHMLTPQLALPVDGGTARQVRGVDNTGSRQV